MFAEHEKYPELRLKMQRHDVPVSKMHRLPQRDLQQQCTGHAAVFLQRNVQREQLRHISARTLLPNLGFVCGGSSATLEPLDYLRVASLSSENELGKKKR